MRGSLVCRADTSRVLEQIIALGHTWSLTSARSHLDFAGKRVLEVGCGRCWHAPLVLGLGAASYTGIEPHFDGSTRQVPNLETDAGVHSDDRATTAAPLTLDAWLDSYPSCSVIPRGILDAELEPGSFDIALMFTVTEHLPRPEEELARLAESMCPGGRLYLVHGNYYSWSGHHLRPQHVGSTS